MYFWCIVPIETVFNALIGIAIKCIIVSPNALLLILNSRVKRCYRNQRIVTHFGRIRSEQYLHQQQVFWKWCWRFRPYWPMSSSTLTLELGGFLYSVPTEICEMLLTQILGPAFFHINETLHVGQVKLEILFINLRMIE